MTRITTVTLEERAGQTLLVVHDLYPSKEALDEDVSKFGWPAPCRPQAP